MNDTLPTFVPTIKTKEKKRRLNLLPIALIIINGPPQSGKSTAAGMMMDSGYASFFHMSLAAPIKATVHRAIGMPDSTPNNYFEARKDVPCEEFFGQVPRQAYINYSEQFMKPTFGVDIFGRLCAARIQRAYNFWYSEREKAQENNLPLGICIVIDDCGFNHELGPLLEISHVKPTIIQVHREGASFEGDSREWIEATQQPPGIPFHFLYNNGDLHDLQTQAVSLLGDFLNSIQNGNT